MRSSSQLIQNQDRDRKLLGTWGGKNRQVDEVVTLPAGNYKLPYKSDDSHSFDHWNALPPDISFWGMAVYKK